MNNTEYEYNRACIVVNGNVGSTAHRPPSRKDFVNSLRKGQFLRYNKFFEEEINRTVENNNRGIYTNCIEFIKQHCIKCFSKDVPTNIVITNCESSSNNDTQFGSLFDALKRHQILNFVIDEKKCGTTKNMISYIQKGVGDLFGPEYKSQGDHSDEELKVVVSSDESSSGDEDSEDDQEERRRGISQKSQKDYPMEDQENTAPKSYSLGRPLPSEKKCEPYQRGDDDFEDYTKAFAKAPYWYLRGLGDLERETKASSLATDKIGFSGVKKMIKNAQCKHPIVIVIQNIKTFPTDNLNDLIYLIKKYRAKHKLKLCLMLGVKSNSYEDLMSKISITTSNFMIVKKFYFPSIKRILLEVIYRLLKSKRNCYIFGTKFLSSIIENIQVYGLSLEKFKRIMHFLIAHHFRTNKYFFVNGMIQPSEEIELLDQIKNEDMDLKCLKVVMKQFEEQNDNLRELENCIKSLNMSSTEIIETPAEELKGVLYEFYKKKMLYFKAYDLLEELCIYFLAADSKGNEGIFKNCFCLNIFSCKTVDQKMKVVVEELEVPDWSKVTDWLLDQLSKRKSRFLIQCHKDLQERISQAKSIDVTMGGKSKPSNRTKKLINSFSKDVFQKEDTEITLNSQDHEKIFKGWLKNYIFCYLNLDLSMIEKEAFILENSQMTARISPDIQGNMAKSIMDSADCIFTNFKANYEVKSKDDLKKSDEEYLTQYEKDVTKLMEGYRLYGKDIDVNDWYKKFCHKIRDEERPPDNRDKHEPAVLADRFLKALGDLKFMGFISESGRGTYIFKRNYFGKNMLKLI
ncbi:unnamed protein product [Moneuplotes crassus]|uniref:Origin recognition complex subunit 3 n=1 Tax=Euplotes crassus TaxID=5936 RepID=A0AAD2DB69_EUPCR|nr:unnamed protein product [Moneuplotes crassus]